MGNGEMKLNRYPKYKPTGIAWLPELPEGWEVRRFRTLYGFGKGLPITKADLKETGIPVISYGQIHAKTNTGVTLDRALLRYVSEEYLTSLPKCLLQLGDMAIADTSEDLEGCGNAVLMDCKEPVFAGYHTIIARIRDRRHDKYLAYVFRSQPWREQVRHLVHGVKVFSVTKQVLSATSFPIPPLAEQRAIVAFLDGKCGKIDRWVAAKEREVALLKELKQSMIAEAVTGATNVARTNTVRKMKPSGIPWFPEVPEGWKMVKVGYCFDENGSGTTPTSGSVDYYDGEINWVQSGDLHGDDICSSKKTITDKALQDYSLKIFQPPFVCMAMYGASIANVSVVRVPACTNQACCVLAKNRKTTDLNYLYRCLSSAVVRQELLLKAQGGTQPNINRSDILGMRIPVPPLAEQREIVAYLDEKCGKIDAAVAGLEREVAAMKEYKQRLIADVVTGQRKVA